MRAAIILLANIEGFSGLAAAQGHQPDFDPSTLKGPASGCRMRCWCSPRPTPPVPPAAFLRRREASAVERSTAWVAAAGDRYRSALRNRMRFASSLSAPVQGHGRLLLLEPGACASRNLARRRLSDGAGRPTTCRLAHRATYLSAPAPGRRIPRGRRTGIGNGPMAAPCGSRTARWRRPRCGAGRPAAYAGTPARRQLHDCRSAGGAAGP